MLGCVFPCEIGDVFATEPINFFIASTFKTNITGFNGQPGARKITLLKAIIPTDTHLISTVTRHHYTIRRFLQCLKSYHYNAVVDEKR